MRVLFSSSPGHGHVLPLVPLAQACRDRGDTVAFATSRDFGPRIEEAGLTHLAAGLEVDELERRYATDRTAIQLLPIPDRRRHAYAWRFARLEAPARVDELRAHARDFEPDVVVHEASDLAAPVVAACLGVPSVHHSFGRLIPATAIELAYTYGAPMWEESGVEADRHLGLFRGAFVDIAPPSLEPEQPPPGTTVLRCRAVERAPADRDAARPLVYVTLGTMLRATAVLRTVIAALADVDVDVLVTTGLQNDPSDLGPLPANAVVERYVPQGEVLPRASLVVTHAGSGSMLGALGHGLPILALPQIADQFENAASVARAGAARVLLPDEVTATAVREAVETLLGISSYRAAAEAVAREIAAMPSVPDLAEQIDELYVSGARA